METYVLPFVFGLLGMTAGLVAAHAVVETKRSIIIIALVSFVFSFTVMLLLPKERIVDSLSSQQDVVTDSGLPAVTERFSARVDRVDVLFEHTDYTRYRLVTNGLVREGELNTERGYAEDENATVYVLNWQEPVGKQQYFVRLTAEPDKLYVLDGNRQLIRSGALSRDTAVQQ